VYFARNGNRIKIGTTKCLAARLYQLCLPRDSAVLVLSGAYRLEGQIHDRFAEYRVPGSEWFRLGPELFTFIRHWKDQPAAFVLGRENGQPPLYEDLDQISARTGHPVGQLRAWRGLPSWPRSYGSSRGRHRLYYTAQVDNWLATRLSDPSERIAP
jgi:hypothetical protein